MPELRLAEANLPPPFDHAVARFLESARSALGDDLKSVVLFGSGAEGKLRPTSDVNLIFVLRSFETSKVDPLREPMRTAHAAINVKTMFLLESEIADALEAFPEKFDDILHRRRVLLGTDPFEGVTLSRPAQIGRLRQVLLNLTLRMRQLYVLRSLREEQAALIVAECAGPLRACAAELAALEGHPAPSAKEALAQMAANVGGDWSSALGTISSAREQQPLAAGAAPATILKMIHLAQALRQRVARLS